MRAIQSFRSEHIRPALEAIGGPAMLRGQLFTMGLSACTIAQHYKDFVYITDDAGKNMAEECKFPFTEIVSVGSNFNSSPSFWTHSKFTAYQSEVPFLHFDNDVFLWEPLPAKLNDCPVIALHGESFMWPLYEDHLDKAITLPNFPKWHEVYFSNRTPINMAVFGGSDLQTIKQYSDEVLDIVLNKMNGFDFNEVDSATAMTIMPVVEQLWASYIIQSKLGKKITFILNEKNIAKGIPNEEIKLTHLGGRKAQAAKDSVESLKIFNKIVTNFKSINPEVHKATQKFTSSAVNLEELMESK